MATEEKKAIAIPTWGFAVVVVRNEQDGKVSKGSLILIKKSFIYESRSVICSDPVPFQFLAVLETGGRGWWLPAGKLDIGETYVCPNQIESN